METFDVREYCLEHKILSSYFHLSWNKTTQKKNPGGCKWSEITTDNLKKHHKNKDNGFLIVTGHKNKLIVIDTDITKAQIAGKPIPEGIIKGLGEDCSCIVKTPNGRHYYFKTDYRISKQTGSYWNGEFQEHIDILGEKSIIIAPPSHYEKDSGIICQYLFEKGNLSTIGDLPEELYKLIQPPTIEIVSHNKIPNNKQDAINNIDFILEHLSLNRWKQFNTWIAIGMALKNSGFDVEVWDKHSQIAPNYRNGSCHEYWKTFREKQDGLTIGSICYWLKEDDIDAFVCFKAIGRKKIELLAEVSQANYAYLYFICNEDKYKYTPEQGWYEIKPNNTWRCLDGKQPTDIKTSISKFFKEFIEHTITEQAIDDEELIKTLNKGIFLTSSSSWSQGCIDYLKELYTDDTFFEKVDANPNLLCFKDKVWDINICGFREIAPDDCISITTGYEAPDIATTLHPELKNFLESLFENNAKLDYLLDILSYSLFGHRFLQRLMFWKGKGGNGKSALGGLFSLTLGDYIRDFPVSNITKPDDKKDNVSPALISAKPARVLICGEPENKEKLQVSFLNKISGGDPITTRTLYSKAQITYIPQFQFIFHTNDCRLNKVDLAVKRRLDVIDFPFLFRPKDVVDSAGEDSNLRVIKEEYIELFKSPELRDSFIIFLLKRYKKNYKPTIPKSIIDDTNTFLQENNIISTFIDSNIVVTHDKNDFITSGDIYKLYLEKGGDKIRTNEFNTLMSSLGFESKRNRSLNCVGYFGLKKKESEFGE